MDQQNSNEKNKKNFFSNIRKSQWIKFSIAAIIYVAFIIWVGNYIWLLGLLLIADIYLTHFIPWGFWRKSKNVRFRKTMEWIDAILYALIAVYFINTFFFQNYKIPTPSLEKTLLVGDYLFVSKMSYGPRVPNTPLSFPLAQHTLPIVDTKSYIEWPQWDYKRMKGFGSVKQNDIVVFNFPTGDTVALMAQNPDYHSLVYQFGKEAYQNKKLSTNDTTTLSPKDPRYYDIITQFGREYIRNNKNIFGDIVYRPVDRRENFVKRAVGLPGETIEIKNNELYIDGERVKDPKNLQFNYQIVTNGGRLTEEQFRKLDISVDDRNMTMGADGSIIYWVPLTLDAVEKAKKYKFITSVTPDPGSSGNPIFPPEYDDQWTHYNYGPLWIPKKGETVSLNFDNLPFYRRIIQNYEGNTLEIKDNQILINGKVADNYTFNMDYYFMMGDNRDNSADSRFWGFVPEDHVVGKPLLVWLSIDKDRSWFDGRIRFDRFFKRVTQN